jgi:hypothetical protein
MEKIAVEVVDAGPKRDTRGRRVTDRTRREALLSAYDQSGLTQKAFAQREGVNVHTFVSWLQHRRRWSLGGGSDVENAAFTELAMSGASIASVTVLEVVLPGGEVVRGRSASEVAASVRALRA